MATFDVRLHQPGVYNPTTGKAVTYTLYEVGSGDSDYLLNATLKLEVNKAGTFEFDILPSHTHYSILRRYIHYVSVKEINDSVSDEIVFYGRILSMNLSFNGIKHIVCEGLMANLLDCPMYNLGLYMLPTDGEMGPDKLFTIYGTAYKMFYSAIKAYRNRIRTDIDGRCAGVFNLVDLDPIDVSSGTSVGDFITSELVDSQGGLLEMAYSENENGDITGTLNWGPDPSMDSYSYPIYNPPVVEFGVNLLDLSGECDDDEIVTGIVPTWEDNENEKHWITISRKDVDSDANVYLPFITGANGGLNAVGIKVTDIPGAKSQEKARNYAENYVSRYCSNYILSGGSVVDFDSFTVRALDIHFINNEEVRKIWLYSPVVIKCKPHGIDRRLMCTSVDVSIDSPENSSYTFSIYRPKASSNDKVLTRQLKRSNSNKRGMLD